MACKAGEMHPAAAIFYAIAIQQRNLAWRTIERLEVEVKELRDALERAESDLIQVEEMCNG